MPYKLKILAWALLLGLLMALAACQPPEEPPPAPDEPALLKEGEASLAELLGHERRCLAYCGLAEQAEVVFPHLAAEYYQRALQAAQGAADLRYLAAADRLRAEKFRLPGPDFPQKAGMLALELEKRSRIAWCYRLVADGARVLEPGLAQRALELGLEQAERNPPGRERDWDLAGLIISLARNDRERAQGLCARVADPWVRSWLHRRLAAQLRDAGLLQKAGDDAARIENPAASSLVLAQVGGDLWELEAPGGDRAFRRALQRAKDIPDPQRARMVAAECAARFLGPTSPLLLDRIWELSPGRGARFKALHQAAQSLLVRDPDRGRQVWQAALTEAGELELDSERAQALALLVRDMAALDPRESERALAEAREAGVPAVQEAEADLILAGAGRDLDGALQLAQGLSDYSLRFSTLARLALVQYRHDPARGKKVYQLLLASAARLGFDLVPPEILAQTAFAVRGEGAMELAGAIPDPLSRSVYLFNLAKIFTKNKSIVAGRKSLEISLTTIKSADTKLILDKVRLLGDMGRGWVKSDAEQAERIFGLAAALIQ